MHKFKLKPLFSLKIGAETILGPCEVELSDEQAEMEKHKIEPVDTHETETSEKHEPVKKAKKKKDH